MNYIWHNQQLVAVPDMYDPAIKGKYIRAYLYAPDEDWSFLYIHRDGTWSPRQLEDMPSEFRLALLLLGVS